MYGYCHLFLFPSHFLAFCTTYLGARPIHNRDQQNTRQLGTDPKRRYVGAMASETYAEANPYHAFVDSLDLRSLADLAIQMAERGFLSKDYVEAVVQLSERERERER